jgi:hypothetical protein
MGDWNIRVNYRVLKQPGVSGGERDRVYSDTY